MWLMAASPAMGLIIYGILGRFVGIRLTGMQLFLLIAFIFAVGLSLTFICWRRVRGHVVAHNLHVCVNCAYILDGLDSIGQCPECGVRYDLRHLERIWRRSYFIRYTSCEKTGK
jgi:hypothetical protein